MAVLEGTTESVDVDLENVSAASSLSYSHGSIMQGALDEINNLPKYEYRPREKKATEVEEREVTSLLNQEEVCDRVSPTKLLDRVGRSNLVVQLKSQCRIS